MLAEKHIVRNDLAARFHIKLLQHGDFFRTKGKMGGNHYLPHGHSALLHDAADAIDGHRYENPESKKPLNVEIRQAIHLMSTPQRR